jgi:hypothetical protein
LVSDDDGITDDGHATRLKKTLAFLVRKPLSSSACKKTLAGVLEDLKKLTPTTNN